MNLKKHRFTKKKKVRHLASGQRTFASAQAHAFLNGLAAVAVIVFISFYCFLTPVNPQSIPFWLTVIIALFAFAAVKSLTIVSEAASRMQDQASGDKTWQDICGGECRLFLLPIIVIVGLLLVALTGSPIFSAQNMLPFLMSGKLFFLMIYPNLLAPIPLH